MHHEWHLQCTFKILHCLHWRSTYFFSFHRSIFQTSTYILSYCKKNGLVVSKTKFSLFQTCDCFLGHYICQGTVTPIQRSLTFIDKFLYTITNKTQLQRFLGSLNYVLDYYPNISRLAIPLHDRLKTNPIPSSDLHTNLSNKLRNRSKPFLSSI